VAHSEPTKAFLKRSPEMAMLSAPHPPPPLLPFLLKQNLSREVIAGSDITRCFMPDTSGYIREGIKVNSMSPTIGNDYATTSPLWPLSLHTLFHLYLTPSHCHTLTLSHPHTQPHIVPPSHPHTVTPSHPASHSTTLTPSLT